MPKAMDINFLPPSLRDKETKELSKPAPKGAARAFHLPPASTNKRWWERLFTKSAAGSKPPVTPVEAKVEAPKLKEVSKPPVNVEPKSVKPTKVKKIEERSPMKLPVGVVLDVNLLPTDSRPVASSRQLWPLGATVVMAIILVSLSYAIVSAIYLTRIQEKNEIDRRFSLLQAQVTKATPEIKELDRVSQNMKAVQGLLSAQTHWSKFFPELEKITLKDVSFGNFSVSPGFQISMSVEAKNIKALAKQLKVFKEATYLISTVNMGTVAGVSDKENKVVKSSFQLQLKPDWVSRVSGL